MRYKTNFLLLGVCRTSGQCHITVLFLLADLTTVLRKIPFQALIWESSCINQDWCNISDKCFIILIKPRARRLSWNIRETVVKLYGLSLFRPKKNPVLRATRPRRPYLSELANPRLFTKIPFFFVWVFIIEVNRDDLT